MRWHLGILALLVTTLLLPAKTAGAADDPQDLSRKARTVLATLEGQIAVPGLQEPVEVLRDRWGIPHIYARNSNDLFFAQGFVVAQDRLFQLEMWRRTARGETAEIVGKQGLAGDRLARLLRYRGDTNAEWTSYSPDTQPIAASFTRGINAYIDRIGDRLPVEFQLLGRKPVKWQPEDVLGRMAGIVMTRNFRNEVLRAELVAALGIEKARRVAPTDPIRAYAPVPGLDLAGITGSILAEYEAATKPLAFSPSGDGSNNWVVDGTRSTSGKPMLASDPHRAIPLPSLRYLVHLHAPGWNVIGSGEPALPGVAIGHNEHVAWGFTIVGTDQADLYVEETNPTNPAQYKVGDRWEAMKVVKEKVKVRGMPEPVELELRFTRHGPVLYQDEKRRRAYALRWVGNEPGGAAYLPSLALDRARNAREFVQALKRWKSPAENMVYADVDGTIGWVATALTPVRKGWDGLLPVPGAGGKHEWQGFLPLEELPQLVNPPSHVIATANHNILPSGYRHEIAYEWAAPYRYQQIKRRLDAKQKFDLNEFKSIQQDSTSIPGQVLVRLLKEAAIKDANLRPFVTLLTGWDGVLTRESAAGALYAVWLQELLDAFFKPHVPAQLLRFARDVSGVPVMLEALAKPTPFWFGDRAAAGRDELLRQTLTTAVARTRKLLGDDPKQWAWGKLHTATFRHPLAGLGPAHARAFNLTPVGRPGDGLTPNATRHDAKFAQLSGASYRHVLDLADWDRGLATSTPGQSGQPGSPHYGDLLPLWEKGEYFPLAFSRKKVEEVCLHRLVLKPAKK